jgi:hypothetical protein
VRLEVVGYDVEHVWVELVTTSETENWISFRWKKRERNEMIVFLSFPVISDLKIV